MRTLLRTSLRAMNERDLPQIADIERESFTTMWPQTAYKRELSNSVARYFVLAETGEEQTALEEAGIWGSLRRRLGGRRDDTPEERVLGFIGLWLMVGEAHVVTFAVRESHRRMGVGERLLIAAFDCALENSQQCLTLEVRRTNDAAQRLYEKYEMEQVGVRPRYYTDNNEDAVIMTSPGLGEPVFRDRLERLREMHRSAFPDLWA